MKADLNQAAADLAALGFRSIRSTTPAPGPNYDTDCAGSATGGVGKFLTGHPCKEYATATLAGRSHGATAQVSMTWVVMPTTGWAAEYKAKADTPGEGNPPGQPPAFNGLCYASGQNGTTVWTEQVQPTRALSAETDRKILQAAAPTKLTHRYLQHHCIG